MRRSGTVVSEKGNFSATFSAKLHLQQRNKRQNGAIETFLLLFGGDRFLGLFNHRRTHTQAIIHEKRFELDSVQREKVVWCRHESRHQFLAERA